MRVSKPISGDEVYGLRLLRMECCIARHPSNPSLSGEVRNGEAEKIANIIARHTPFLQQL